MLLYKQKTGQLYRGDMLLAVCYSGFGSAKNDPLAQNVQNIGPIPVGAYNIGALSENTDHGPVAFHLVPCIGTETFYRSGFMMHGDSIAAPGAASHGCIIAPRPVREAILEKDKLLVVISGCV